jgi:hypothetical protein
MRVVDPDDIVNEAAVGRVTQDAFARLADFAKFRCDRRL